MADRIDAATPDPAGDQKSDPSEPVEQLQKKDAKKREPTKKNSRNNHRIWMTRCFRRARAEWKPLKIRDKIGLLFEGTGLLVLLVYTVFTALMYCANKKAAEAAKSAAETAQSALTQNIESFRIDERAWVEIEPIKPVLLDDSQKFGATFTCDIFPKNVGKTVATDVVVKAWEFGAADGADSSPEFVTGVQDKFLLQKMKGLSPNEPPVMPRPLTKVIAPNTASAAPFRLTCQSPKNGMTHYLIGRVDYCDQFRVKHTMRFCYFVVNARGEIWNCQEGNDEDHNPETTPDPTCNAN